MAPARRWWSRVCVGGPLSDPFSDASLARCDTAEFRNWSVHRQAQCLKLRDWLARANHSIRAAGAGAGDDEAARVVGTGRKPAAVACRAAREAAGSRRTTTEGRDARRAVVHVTTAGVARRAALLATQYDRVSWSARWWSCKQKKYHVFADANDGGDTMNESR